MSGHFIGEVTICQLAFSKFGGAWAGLSYCGERFRAIDFGLFGSSPCHFALIDSFLI